MTTLTTIGLAFPPGLDHCRGVLRGVRRYADGKPGWAFAQCGADPDGVAALRRSRPAGLIAYVCSEPLARAVRRFPGPVVNVCGALAGLPLPAVGIDNAAVGAAAAGHFLERGLRHFAFLGHGDFAFSVRRGEGFRGRLGRAVPEFRAPAGDDFRPDARPPKPPARLCDWLRALPKPVGLFACNDIWGGCAAEACRRAGLAIPDEVAVLGVDDDDLLCELARPPLSSIRVPSERIGSEAAALLDGLLAGGGPPAGPVLFGPVGVAVRQSSDLLAVEDAEVAAVLRAIRSAGGRPVGVADVVRDLGVCRRSAERRFRQTVGRGIAAEIRRQRVERAKELIAGTDLSLGRIAERVGFPNPQRFAAAFRREAGTTPTGYRAAHGLRHRGRAAGLV